MKAKLGIFYFILVSYVTCKFLTLSENPPKYLAENEVLKLTYDQKITKNEKKNVTGEGYIKWDGWKDLKKVMLLNGNLKVSLIDDPIYTSMKLPSEAITAMEYRVNPTIMDTTGPGYVKSVGIAAAYQAKGSTLPDEFNLNIGRFMTLILRTEPNANWEIFTVHEPLDKIKYFQFHKLPWSESYYYRPEDKMVLHENYVEFKCKKEDFDGFVFHFYGDKAPIASENVRAYVTIFDIWSDTKGIEGGLAIGVGVDQWPASGSSHQMFSGRNYLVKNTHRLMIGHNIPDSMYEELIKEGKNPKMCLDIYNNYKK